MNLTYTSSGEMQTDGAVAITLLQDISGMYKLVPAKESDSYYDTQVGQTYVTLPVPNPSFKTGYLNE